jgi:hypothetical protein
MKRKSNNQSKFTIMQTFRKPYLAVIMSSLILFISCSEGATPDIKRSFNYESFNLYKNSNHYKNVMESLSKLDLSKSTYVEQKRIIVDEVNDELNTDLELSDIALSLSVDMEPEQIYSVGLSNNWIKQQDVDLSEQFGDDLEAFGFDIAVSNYENTVLNLNLSDEEFARKNAFVNIIKIIHDENPSMFPNGDSSVERANLQTRSWWRCALAATALVASTASLVSCATIGGCILAMALVYNASLAVAEQC